MSVTEEKKVIEECDAYLDTQMEELWELSLYIHRNPEMAFQEYKSCEAQCRYLEKAGYEVERKAGGLDTAYTAQFRSGEGGPVLAIVAEYDALPIGHACGHNLIAASAVGVAVEIKKYLELTRKNAVIKVIGAPAEESGGGKILLLKEGIFDGVDAVFMMHPTSAPTRLAGACMSSREYRLTYKGMSAHANSHPDNGINALSAASLFLTATGLLRQQFKGDARLSAIITDGGIDRDLIPERAEVSGAFSCFAMKDLEHYTEVIRRCAKGCGDAVGCETELEIIEGYQGRVPNETLSELCKEELRRLGEPLLDGMPSDFGGEDLGNVSRQIPICNPYVTIFPEYKISNHTEQFRDLAGSPAGERCVRVTSKAIAGTLARVLENPGILDEAKAELKERMEQ